MSLDLIQPSNECHMRAVKDTFRMDSTVINYYLSEIVFPRTMVHFRFKISASGQELGSSTLFGRRLGFSGTPSNLLPTELTPCLYERGSEGEIIRMLTDKSVTIEASLCATMSDHWAVDLLLDHIAQSSNPPFRALIDTGTKCHRATTIWH